MISQGFRPNSLATLSFCALFPEGVDMFLNNHKLLAFRGYRLLYLRAAGPFDEYWGIGIFGFVSYVKNGNAGISCMTDHTASIRYSVFDAAQR